jgi:predicted PurR-regulated permease PerM
MNFKLTPGLALAASVVLLAGWIVHGFIDALLAASVTAVATWPLYERFRARVPARIGPAASAAMFTLGITVLVLAPLVLAGAALLSEARELLLNLLAADSRGTPAPAWLAGMPVLGTWLAEHWGSGALQTLTQRTEPSTLLGWVQIVGQFTARQALVVAFAVLLLSSFYREGEALASALSVTLRRLAGEPAQRYVNLATRVVRSAAMSMLAVAVFDALAAWAAFALAGAPRALVWASIAGALAAMPFLGYAAVAAMATELAMKGATTAALLALVLGCVVLLLGDKFVRPMVARGGIRLPFVWILMGCLGGFTLLGPAGLVIGPLVLALAAEAWEQATRVASR